MTLLPEMNTTSEKALVNQGQCLVSDALAEIARQQETSDLSGLQLHTDEDEDPFHAAEPKKKHNVGLEEMEHVRNELNCSTVVGAQYQSCLNQTEYRQTFLFLTFKLRRGIFALQTNVQSLEQAVRLQEHLASQSRTDSEAKRATISQQQTEIDRLRSQIFYIPVPS